MSVTPGTADWQPVAVGDANNNGSADIYWRHKTLGYNSIWIMQGTNYISSASFDSLSLDWELCDVNHFAGVGHTDIMWRLTNTVNKGQNAVWLMSNTNSATLLEARSLGSPITDMDWMMA